MARRINPKTDNTYAKYVASQKSKPRMDNTYARYVASQKAQKARPRMDNTYTNYIANQNISDEYDFLDQYEYEEEEGEGKTFWETLKAPFTWKYWQPYSSRPPTIFISQIILLFYVFKGILYPFDPRGIPKIPLWIPFLLQAIIEMSSLKQGYEHPVHDGVYAWVHLLNALTAIFLWFAATSRPFFPSFILLFLAYGFQLGLPLPSSRMSLSHGLDYSNIPLRLANLLLGIPELLRGRPEGLVVWLCISLLPAPLHFGLLIFDVRRLWKPMTPKEKANRILRQAQSRPALYRGYDDDETMSITQRLRRKWREFLKKCDQFYDRLEREEEAKKAESNRRSLNRGDDDFDVNRPLNAPSTGPSKPGTGILRQTTIELSPNTSGSSRSYSSSPSPSSGHHHQHHGRNSQFLSWITSRGKDAGRPGNTARPLQQKPSRTRQTPARTWGESLLDTYHEVKQDLTWYVSTTVEMAVIVVCRVMIPYLVIRGILRMADWATTVGLSQLVPDIREYLKGVLVMPTFKMPSLKMSSLWNKLDMDGRLAYVWESLARVFGPLWGMFRRSATWTTN